MASAIKNTFMTIAGILELAALFLALPFLLAGAVAWGEVELRLAPVALRILKPVIAFGCLRFTVSIPCRVDPFSRAPMAATLKEFEAWANPYGVGALAALRYEKTALDACVPFVFLGDEVGRIVVGPLEAIEAMRAGNAATAADR